MVQSKCSATKSMTSYVFLQTGQVKFAAWLMDEKTADLFPPPSPPHHSICCPSVTLEMQL